MLNQAFVPRDIAITGLAIKLNDVCVDLEEMKIAYRREMAEVREELNNARDTYWQLKQHQEKNQRKSTASDNVVMYDGVQEEEADAEHLSMRIVEIINENYMSFDQPLASRDSLSADHLGRPNNKRPGTVRVVLNSDWHKMDVVKYRVHLKGTRIFVNEELSGISC